MTPSSNNDETFNLRTFGGDNESNYLTYGGDAGSDALTYGKDDGNEDDHEVDDLLRQWTTLNV